MTKKILVAIALVAVVIGTLTAGDFETTDFYEKNFSIAGTNADLLGMGGAGVAIMDNENAFFTNPAALAEKKFKLSLPSVSVTTYHVNDLTKKDENGKSAIDKIKDSENTSAMISSLLDVVGTQFAPLMRADASLAMALPFGLGLGVYTGDTVYTYSGSVIDTVDVTASLGFAHSFKLGSAKLAVGLAGKFSAFGVSERVKAADFSALSDEDATMIVAVATGWTPLLDVGATLSWHGFNFGVACTNIFLSDGYKMDIESVEVKNIGSEYEKFVSLEREGDFKLKYDPNLKVGVAYELDTSLLDLKVACDLTDLITLYNERSTLDGRRILKNISAGAEVGLLDMLKVRGGLSSGYWTAGASVDIWLLRLDCAYFWQELGTSAGQRGLDGLTIRFNLGWER